MKKKSRNNAENKRKKEFKNVALCVVCSDELFRKASIIFFLMA
jgi:hypothetical protein